MLVLFFLTLMVLAVAAAAPDVFTQSRRLKEEEMIWRGKQYERGIKLFYQKNHRIPTSLEELTQARTGIRFMRKAYLDPMNQVDGSWRLIYIGPGGQLIGSTRPSVVFRYSTPGGSAQASGGLRGQNNGSSFGSQDNASSFGNSFSSQTSGSSFGSQNGGSSFGSQNNPSSFASQNGGGSFGAQNNGSSFGSSNRGNSSDSADDGATAAQSISQPASDSPVLGASIIGVGSKVNAKSILWLDGAKNYLQFEFIWDPSKEGMGVNPAKLLTTPTVAPQTPTGTIGQFGTPPSQPFTNPQ